jgi:hypothetical protein
MLDAENRPVLLAGAVLHRQRCWQEFLSIHRANFVFSQQGVLFGTATLLITFSRWIRFK